MVLSQWIEVSGEHLVEYQDRFIKVMDHPESYEIEKKTDDVICLATNNGIIKTKITFLLIILILILVNWRVRFDTN